MILSFCRALQELGTAFQTRVSHVALYRPLTIFSEYLVLNSLPEFFHFLLIMMIAGEFQCSLIKKKQRYVLNHIYVVQLTTGIAWHKQYLYINVCTCN